MKKIFEFAQIIGILLFVLALFFGFWVGLYLYTVPFVFFGALTLFFLFIGYLLRASIIFYYREWMEKSLRIPLIDWLHSFFLHQILSGFSISSGKGDPLPDKAKGRVGILVSHEEVLNPQNDEWGLFFKAMDSYRRKVEVVEEPLTASLLESFEAILIGGPQKPLEEAEIKALRDWVDRGGSLMVFSSLGGDKAPSGKGENQTNLSALFPGLVFPDHALCELDTPKGPPGRREIIPKLLVEFSNLAEPPTALIYHAGTTIEFETNQSEKPKGWASLLNKKGAGRIWPKGWFFLGRKESYRITHSLRPPYNSYRAERTRFYGDRLANVPPSKKEKIEWPDDICGDTCKYTDHKKNWSRGFLFLRFLAGLGKVSLFGAAWSFKDNTLIHHSENSKFLHWLLSLWLPDLIDHELERRLGLPQRHRLLQGYPMAPMMPLLKERPLPSDSEKEETGDKRLMKRISTDLNRAQIIGILPHPFCNPRVKGCGFCTFPHEKFGQSRAREMIEGVVKEIHQFQKDASDLCQRKVRALYFGGGTANLTPPESFRALCQKVSGVFDLSESEVTLEGVPIYFQKPELLDIMQEEIPGKTFRISMGIQTFDKDQIRSMGREAFGDEETLREIVKMAEKRSLGLSGDFLFNLPGQTLEEMKEDIKRALDIGMEQLCLYHLVLFEGLGTAWAEDRGLLDSIPSNEKACENWLVLREMVLSQGFVQTSLTNFEHRDLPESPSRYTYEDCSFHPEIYDALGFGPGGISFFGNMTARKGTKLVNFGYSESYVAEVSQSSRAWERWFDYDIVDLKILYLTRHFSILGVNRRQYRSLFGTDPLGDFPEEFEGLFNKGLLEADGEHLHLTPRGMFYADTVVGLLAWRQVQYWRTEFLKRTAKPSEEKVQYEFDDSLFMMMG